MKPSEPRPDEIAARRSWFERLSGTFVLFPAIAVAGLATIWILVANLISFEQRAAEQAAESSILELANTYEAQVLRNLRELDNTVKVVKYAYESSPHSAVLVALREKDLLPPEFLFVVRVLDARGELLMSTRRNDRMDTSAQRDPPGGNMPDLWISEPRKDAVDDSWKLDFSRALNAADGSFSGSVMVSVDAAYFVSGYESSNLGASGVLALVGAEDGRFRIRRTGESEFSDEAFGDPALLAQAGTQDTVVARGPNAWDGVERYTAIKQLFSFPLTLVVGVSEAEQMLEVRANARVYRIRAAFASALFLVLVVILARGNWKVAQTIRRENEAKRAHAEELRHLAYHDGLTGLPNRRHFSLMLEHGIAEARRYNKALAVLFLDLDRFKHINDTLGHHAGDLMLQEIARRLKGCLRETDLVARLGGDEFVVMLLEFDAKKYATTVAQKVLAVISEPLPLEDQNLIGTSSIGIAVYPIDGDDEQALTKCADAAMYHAKELGRNNFQFYSEQLRINSTNRLKIETNLRRALQLNELRVVYQPKIDLGSNRIVGMEALLRWDSAQLGSVSPMEFIPIAEDTGLIVAIGKWVLETACTQLVSWVRQGMPQISVSVNLSGRQFSDDNLVKDIADILQTSGCKAEFLELEITESMLMNNLDDVTRTLTTLSDMGMKLSVDDFGTGFSSLSYLKRFPIDTLKIDRSFVTLLPHNEEDAVITVAIINMARALRLSVVAEGVETQQQADFLRRNGCDQYQGYLFSKPVGAEEFRKLLDVQRQSGHAT